jgi:DNA primase catalytic subunit
MIHISTLLRHYKRLDVQNAMVNSSKSREIAVRFDKGFGKRPDILSYPNDVLEMAKKGATSFHVSEERWENPLHLLTGMRKKDQDALRTGWDLVLDIDCKSWKYSKIITNLLIQELKIHGVKSISCKFSGNKGFHIGVPFEAFPESIHDEPVKALFPEGVRRIATYLTMKIEPKLLSYIKANDSIENINKELAKPVTQKTVCKQCDKEQETKQKFQFTCPKCNHQIFTEAEEKYKTCPQCSGIMLKADLTIIKCRYCQSTNFEEKLDLTNLLDVDTVLISSRHLYRMPYSLHEKSGLVSIPVNPETILDFKKEEAKPEHVNFSYKFLDTTNTQSGEAAQLILEAFDFKPESVQKAEKETEKKFKQSKKFDDIDEVQEKIPEELFPPCIKIGLQGMEDGRKRFLFAATNFLSSAGYTNEEMQEIFDEWNKKNPEALREVNIKGHLRYHKSNKKNVMPPNCGNKAYYKDLGICKPDLHCPKIKNPFQYAKRKMFILKLKENSGRQKLTEEQKEMRRKFRAQKKEDGKEEELIDIDED